MADRRRTGEQQGTLGENPGYEIFILALSVLSLVNLVLLVSPWPLDGEQKT